MLRLSGIFEQLAYKIEAQNRLQSGRYEAIWRF